MHKTTKYCETKSTSTRRKFKFVSFRKARFDGNKVSLAGYFTPSNHCAFRIEVQKAIQAPCCMYSITMTHGMGVIKTRGFGLVVIHSLCGNQHDSFLGWTRSGVRFSQAPFSVCIYIGSISVACHHIDIVATVRYDIRGWSCHAATWPLTVHSKLGERNRLNKTMNNFPRIETVKPHRQLFVLHFHNCVWHFHKQ